MSTAHAWWESASEEAPAQGEVPGASVLDQILQTGPTPSTPAPPPPAAEPEPVAAVPVPAVPVVTTPVPAVPVVPAPVPAVPPVASYVPASVPSVPAEADAPETDALEHPDPVPEVTQQRAELDPELAQPSNSSIATLSGLMRPEQAGAAASTGTVLAAEAHDGPSGPEMPVLEANDDLWTEIERAAAAARLSETPEAWRALAMTAEVVSAFAQTMESIAEAKLTVRRIEEAADEARQLAERAVAHATEAERVAAELSRAAEEAELRARAAARTAAEAKDRAADAVVVVPALQQAAEEAEATSMRAREQHHELEEALAAARRSNTPDAWRHALTLSRRLKECGPPQADLKPPGSADA